MSVFALLVRRSLSAEASARPPPLPPAENAVVEEGRDGGDGGYDVELPQPPLLEA